MKMSRIKLKKVTVNIGDSWYELTLDEEKYNELSQNPEDLHSYAKEILQNKENVSSGSEEQFIWNSKSTNLLLDLRLNTEDQFNHPTCRKHTLWNRIAEQFNTEGYNITGSMCDKKYRNLLATYRSNKKKRDGGDPNITWEYFEKFDEILGYKEPSAPQKEFLGSSLSFSLDPTGESSVPIVHVDVNAPKTESESNESSHPSRSSRSIRADRSDKDIMTVSEYYRQKLNFMKLKEKKWLEMKEKHFRRREALERERINAINRLASALMGRRRD